MRIVRLANFATGVLELLARGEPARRRDARRQAERFAWSRSVAGFLATHGVPVKDAVVPAAPLLTAAR